MKLEEGKTVKINGHLWLIWDVLNTNDKGETCIQVQSLTKVRRTKRNPKGAIGWQMAWWVKADEVEEHVEFDDYAKGEYDCLHGHDALDNQSDDYYNGFADQYAAEQIATNISELGRLL